MISREVLTLDVAAVARDLEQRIREAALGTLRRRGIVVGVSGGIDSSVVAALAVRALGRDKVLCLLMPERASSSASVRLGNLLCEALGVKPLLEELEPMLEAAGCYAGSARSACRRSSRAIGSTSSGSRSRTPPARRRPRA